MMVEGERLDYTVHRRSYTLR